MLRWLKNIIPLYHICSAMGYVEFADVVPVGTPTPSASAGRDGKASFLERGLLALSPYAGSYEFSPVGAGGASLLETRQSASVLGDKQKEIFVSERDSFWKSNGVEASGLTSFFFWAFAIGVIMRRLLQQENV